MTEALKIIGTIVGIGGALLIALNVDLNFWGFAVFLVSSVSLLAVSIATKDRLYSLLFAAYTGVNVVGIVRWL